MKVLFKYPFNINIELLPIFLRKDMLLDKNKYIFITKSLITTIDL